MSERLTDAELTSMEQWAASDLQWQERGDVLAVVSELRALRSHPPLSADERAVLLRIRDYFDDAVFIQWSTTALAVLDRLLAASETQGESK